MIKTLDDIVAAAKKKGRKRLVVAYAEDAHTIEAASEAVTIGLVEATLLGDPAVIRGICAKEGFDHRKFNIVEEIGDVNCVERAVRMISQGGGDILMKGLVSSDKYMRGILNREYGLVPPKGVLSHIVVMQLPGYHKLLMLTDVAIIPYPDLKQKMAMLGYMIETAHSLGIEKPKIACIAPSEQVLPSVISSSDGAVLAKMGDRGQFGDAIVDGPLALDIALFREIAEIKKLKGSDVAGDADGILFPSLDTANVFFKSATQFSKAELAAMVVGTKVPCILTSRGDSKKTKLFSIALGCL